MTKAIMDSITTAIATPLTKKTFDVILEKIVNRRFMIDDNYPINIFCTLFSRFKINYSLDEINHIIFKSISDFRIEDKDCSYCVDNTKFSIIPYFAYTQPSLDDENLVENEYKTYPDDELTRTFVPGVTGVTLFVFLDKGDKQSIKNSQILLDKIDNTLLETVNVKQHGKFLYFDTENKKIKKKLIDKLSKEFQKHDEIIKDCSAAENELKLCYSDLILERIAKIL